MSEPQTAPLAQEERVVVFPSFGALEPDGRAWRIHICGRVSAAPNFGLGTRLQLRVLRQMMRAEPEAMQSELFQQRIAGFLTAPRRGRFIAVQFGARTCWMPRKTSRSGVFLGAAPLAAEELPALAAQGAFDGQWLHYRVMTDASQVFIGRSLLAAPEGLSVVSDIDDTIKFTGVGVRRLLLANTFLRDFVPITGMAELYRHWAGEGAAFHYVSSSPCQLYEPLSQFCRETGFPDGAFHLNTFRIGQHVLRKLPVARRSPKFLEIRRLLRAYPHRRFLLVGDSGERDPEIYGALARRHRRQIAAVLIRQHPHRPLSAERRRRVFRHLPPSLCQVFARAAEIDPRIADPAEQVCCAGQPF